MTSTIRTRIESLADNRVRLTYEDEIGEVRTREFWAPAQGGYVREESGRDTGTLGQQVCDGLTYRGGTLQWTPTRPLVELIRREYRAMRRAEAKRWAR